MTTAFDFSARRVLVTGGASGLGKAIVEKFLSAGATVFALDRDEAGLASLKQQFPSVHIVTADLSKWDETRSAVDALAPIHHLVNNAAIAEVNFFHDITPESIDRMFRVNFSASINLGQIMSLGLKKMGIAEGTIVNVSSVMAERVFPTIGLYSCTKAAVSTLTKAMALELEPFGIRVNAIRPTVMETSLVRSETQAEKFATEFGGKWCLERMVNKRNLEVTEAANVVLYLSSSQSSMVNGSDVFVDGGLYTS